MARLKTIRWTLEEAAAEFDISRQTLSKRVKSKGIEPGKDHKFSTMDICGAVFSDLEFETTELKKEQKELTRLKKLHLARKLCVTETVVNVVSAWLITARQKVMENPAMSDAAKKDLLLELQAIPVEDYFPESAPTPEVDGEDE